MASMSNMRDITSKINIFNPRHSNSAEFSAKSDHKPQTSNSDPDSNSLYYGVQ
jgi:hypothetical protein